MLYINFVSCRWHFIINIFMSIPVSKLIADYAQIGNKYDQSQNRNQLYLHSARVLMTESADRQ